MEEDEQAEREVLVAELSSRAKVRVLVTGELGDDEICSLMDLMTEWAYGRLGEYQLAVQAP